VNTTLLSWQGPNSSKKRNHLDLYKDWDEETGTCKEEIIPILAGRPIAETCSPEGPSSVWESKQRRKSHKMFGLLDQKDFKTKIHSRQGKVKKVRKMTQRGKGFPDLHLFDKPEENKPKTKKNPIKNTHHRASPAHQKGQKHDKDQKAYLSV